MRKIYKVEFINVDADIFDVAYVGRTEKDAILKDARVNGLMDCVTVTEVR